MAETLGRRMYCVAVTRGRRTVYRYGNRLKDAVALLRLRAGERFRYVVYEHSGVTEGEWHGRTWRVA